MRAMRNLLAAACLLVLAACNNGTTQDADLLMASPDLSSTGGGDMTTPATCCGKPGDVAVNTFGVGKYCLDGTACKDDANPMFKATTCSSAGNVLFPNRPTFFCTFLCTMNGG